MEPISHARSGGAVSDAVRPHQAARAAVMAALRAHARDPDTFRAAVERAHATRTELRLTWANRLNSN